MKLVNKTLVWRGPVPKVTWAVNRVTDSFKQVTIRRNKQYRFDVTITDPPYSEHVHDNMCSGSLVGKKSVPKVESTFDPIKDYEWLRDLAKVTLRWTLCFCDVEAFGLIKTLAPDLYVRSGIWYKHNAMGQLTKDRPATAYEGIAMLHSGDVTKRWNGKGSYGIWRCGSTRGKKDRHPNEKPLDLCLKLVALCSDRGDVVFDPFCGSGTIGEACIRLGRSYVGWDNDPHWVDMARQRLSTVEPYSVREEEALALCTMPKAKEV